MVYKVNNQQDTTQPGIGMQSSGDISSQLRFNKISPIPYALPGVFLFLSGLFLIIGLGGVISNLITQPDLPREDPLFILALSYIQWGMIVYIGYVVSASVISYLMISHLRRHLYDSSIFIYYYTQGSNGPGLLKYLESRYVRDELPAPVTSLILGLVTAGLSYLILLPLAKLKLERHATDEEELLRYPFSKYPDSTRVILDVVLAIITLGAYLTYIGYGFARVFNKHIEKVHALSRETIRSYLGYSRERKEWSPALIALVILLISGSLNIVATSFGLYYGLIHTVSSGLLVSYVAISEKRANLISLLLVILLLLYINCAVGYINGFVNYEFFEPLYENFRNETLTQARKLATDGSAYLTTYIFTNNFALSLPAIIPFAGGVTVMMGCYNAGAILGAFTRFQSLDPIDTLTILLYPHAILELTAYSILVTSSRFSLESSRKFIIMVTIGVSTLLIAAFVETYLILARGTIEP